MYFYCPQEDPIGVISTSHILLMSNMECAGVLIPKSIYYASKNQLRISPYMFCLLLLSITVFIYYGIDKQRPHIILGQTIFSGLISHSAPESPESASEHEKLPFATRETNGSCDLFTGQWIWDNVTHPLYKEEDCPFLDAQHTCLANGRQEKSYQFWRWQPDGCDLPSFNATLLLESIRGKRMLYVGDSLNRGQFFSMVCLVHSLIPETEKSLEYHDNHITFQAKNYNSTIEFYWAPFLLESNSDDILTHKATDRIVRTGSIEKHGNHWKGADIMIFNTYIWWITGSSTIKILEGSFDDKPQHINEVNTDAAYAMSINSMVEWVNKNMDMKKTRVFFTSMSPFHVTSADWGGKQGGSCYNETTMIADKTYWNSECRKSMMQVIKDEFTKSDFPISLLNITQLSSHRKDAHLSIYRKLWKPLTSEELANPISYADCVHFCLPGLQDTWNELLFSKLLFP